MGIDSSRPCSLSPRMSSVTRENHRLTARATPSAEAAFAAISSLHFCVSCGGRVQQRSQQGGANSTDLCGTRAERRHKRPNLADGERRAHDLPLPFVRLAWATSADQQQGSRVGPAHRSPTQCPFPWSCARSPSTRVSSRRDARPCAGHAGVPAGTVRWCYCVRPVDACDVPWDLQS